MEIPVEEKGAQNSGLAHCAFHDIHWILWPDYKRRASDIRRFKPPEEVPLRLALFQIVPSHLLSENFQKALVGWEKALADREKAFEQADEEKAWADLEKAQADLEGAREDWKKAWAQAEPELAELHAQLFPDCPWDGHTIFTRRNERGEWY